MFCAMFRGFGLLFYLLLGSRYIGIMENNMDITLLGLYGV